MKTVKFAMALFVAVSMVACGGEEPAKVEKPKVEKPEDLVVIENGHYIGEYDNGKEIGVWKMYDENGVKTETDYTNVK
jgi:hypothetical protein